MGKPPKYDVISTLFIEVHFADLEHSYSSSEHFCAILKIVSEETLIICVTVT